MRRSIVLRALAALLFLGAAGTASADQIILDDSPDATGLNNGGIWSNVSSVQNFAAPVSFAGAVSVTGMDIYAPDQSPEASRPIGAGIVDAGCVELNERSAERAKPGTLLEAELSLTLSAVDTDGVTSPACPGHVPQHPKRTWATRAPSSRSWAKVATEILCLSGCTTDNSALCCPAPLQRPRSRRSPGLSGPTFNFFPSIGPMAFRLEGTTEDVPRPSTWPARPRRRPPPRRRRRGSSPRRDSRGSA